MARTGTPIVAAFWAEPPETLLAALASSSGGLSRDEAAQRLAASSPGVVPPSQGSLLRLIGRQVANPITLLLLVGAALSIVLGEGTDGVIILVVVGTSAGLGGWQEVRAATAVAQLMALLRTTATVLRDGQPLEIPLEEVVPGDLVRLEAGAAVPGDGVLLDARDCHVDQATLTGESFPSPKQVGRTEATAALADRNNALWLGSHLVSGTATLLVVRTGRETELGRMAGALAAPAPLTEFERGVRRFGQLLMNSALLLGLCIFALHVAMRRPVLEALLFTLAIVIGLTPQLLPAIVGVTLAQGARQMARARVIVRRLSAIEDLGGMAVLCADKTGTLTEGVVAVHATEDWTGQPSSAVRDAVLLNARFESGFHNPIDAALRELPFADVNVWRKRDEVPYDFIRKRLSVAVEPIAEPSGPGWLLTKGAVADMLGVCQTATDARGQTVPLPDVRDLIMERFAALSAQGLRCLGVARRQLASRAPVTAADEAQMTFLGFLTVNDPLRPDATASITGLARLGIRTVMVSGDNRHVAAHVATAAGLDARGLVTGETLHQLTDMALAARVTTTQVFAEVDPSQKTRIIQAFRARGIAVGFLGDGINDAAALHAADVGISVSQASDITRAAADIVLLEKSLAVLIAGVEAGRRAFANTLKYVCITTSANFGNMVSMALASFLVPFLPLLPQQILLNNVLSDLPAMAIATDRLDPELVAVPRRWNTGAIRRFMIAFGLVSSAFDLATFAGLRLAGATPAQFRSAWFLESLLTELAILLVIRTRRPLIRSRASAPMLWGAAAAITIAALVLGWPPLAVPLGFVALSPPLLLLLVAIVAAYTLASELTKKALLAQWPL